MLIDPRSEAARDDVWSDPEAEASWQDREPRGRSAILSEQSLFDDLRRIEKDNSRVEWARDLATRLTESLGPEDERWLREFVARVESAREDMRADEPSREDDRDDPRDAELGELIQRAVCEVGGLVGKERVHADVISPLVLADDDDGDGVGSMLAGEFMGDFGGFLNRELRISDYALGYDCAVEMARRRAAGV